MRLGNGIFLAYLLTTGLSVQAFAEQAKVKAAKRPVRVVSSYSIALSFMMWNEDLSISKGGIRSDGFANYGGYGWGVEKFWLTAKRLNGATIAYGAGKATSGGFSTNPTFADGVNRAWWSVQATLYHYYRVNSIFMIGMGAFGRYRITDWAPRDTALSVGTSPNTQVSGQMLLRWRVSRRFTLIQAYTPLDFKNSSMWTWTAQIEI